MVLNRRCWWCGREGLFLDFRTNRPKTTTNHNENATATRRAVNQVKLSFWKFSSNTRFKKEGLT